MKKHLRAEGLLERRCLTAMTEDKIQQFLTWLRECEAKEESKSIYVANYSWQDKGRHEAFSYIKEMFQTAFREELR